MLLLSGGCSRKTGRELTRGRLRCVQYEKPIVTVSELVWEVFADGKPLEEHRHSGKCLASPDPKAEFLVLGYHSLRMIDGRPRLTPLGGNSPEFGLWACDGRCLVFSGGNLPNKIHHADTGTDEPLPSFAGQTLSLSPDQRTLVAAGRSDSAAHSYCVIDLEARSAVHWTVPRASSPWLEPCNKFGADSGECLAQRGSKFRWQRDGRGRDVLAAPEAAGARSQPSTPERCGK